jgi:hypothetical protein
MLYPDQDGVALVNVVMLVSDHTTLSRDRRSIQTHTFQMLEP